MAENTKKPSILDTIVNGSYDPLGVAQVPAPLLSAIGTPAEMPKGPSLGTEDELQAPAKEAAGPVDDAAPAADGSISLPDRSRQNSAEPMMADAAPPTEKPSFIKKLKDFAGGVTGLTDPSSSSAADKGSKTMSLLGRIGGAMALAAGTPEQKQLAEESMQTPLKIAQLNNEASYRRGMLNIGQQKADTSQQVADTKESVANNATIPLADANINNKNANTDKTEYELETLRNGQFPVDPVTAHLVNRPDLAGKPVSATLWKGLNSVLQARGLKTTDLGPDGLWVLDREGNRVHQISTVSPSMARGEAYGANRPVQALDPTDNTVKWMTAGKAEGMGAAPAGAGQQLMSKEAQFKDIYSGIGAMRSAINGISQEPLDANTIRVLTQATRETDPNIVHQIFDTVLGSQELTPAQQDFVVALQQLNERVLSVRNLAGMGNASDSLRAAIRATLPSAKSGDVSLMRKQLDSVTNFVDNLHTGIPNVKTSAAPNAVAPTAPPPNGPKQSFADWKKSQAGGQ